MMSTMMFNAARRVGIHGLCTEKNTRVSSRLMPPKGRLNANQNSASETSSVDLASKWPRSNTSRTTGVVSTIRNTAEGISSRLIWRMPDADDAAHVRRIAPGRHAAERGEQHGRDRHAEQALGQHVNAKRVVDRARRFAGDERAEHRVDQLVEVDDAQADRHGQHQREHLTDARVCQSIANARRKSIRARAPKTIRNCTNVAARIAIAYAYS